MDDWENNTRFNICHTNEKWLRRGKHLNKKKIHIPQGGNIFLRCLPLCCVGMSTVIVRKSVFEQHGYFDESMQCCEDYDFWLRVSSKEDFFLVDQPLTVKNGGREDQVSSIYAVGMDKFRIYALEKLLNDPEVVTADNYLLAVKNEYERKCRIYGNGCLKHGKHKEGEKFLNMANEMRDSMKVGYGW